LPNLGFFDLSIDPNEKNIQIDMKKGDFRLLQNREDAGSQKMSRLSNERLAITWNVGVYRDWSGESSCHNQFRLNLGSDCHL